MNNNEKLSKFVASKSNWMQKAKERREIRRSQPHCVLMLDHQYYLKPLNIGQYLEHNEGADIVFRGTYSECLTYYLTLDY